jgi:hypothetical protein
MGLLYKQDKIVKVEPENGHDYSYKECQDMVGGFIEVVYLTNGIIAIVDEEGALKPDRWINQDAMLFAMGHGFIGALFGNVLFVDEKELL